MAGSFRLCLSYESSHIYRIVIVRRLSKGKEYKQKGQFFVEGLSDKDNT